MKKALNWHAGLGIVSYAVNLEACKASNEELRAKLAEKAAVETQDPASPSLEKPLE